MQTKGEYTPGPWRVGADLIRVHPNWRDEHGNARADCLHRNGYAKTIAAVGKEDGDWRGILQQCADARLIAAAPDHALIGWAMCVGSGRWEPWGDGRGDFCMNGIRHATKLDEFGVPEMTENMRAAIARAKGLPS